MKFFHSIRWQLQLWHGLLLILVLAGFGFTALRLQQTNLIRRIDRELEQRLAPFIGQVRRTEPGPGGRHNRPPPAAREFRFPPDEPGESRPSFYFVFWWDDGRKTEFPPTQDYVPKPYRVTGPRDFRQRGNFREYFQFTPRGECLLVGRDISEELTAINRSAGLLAGAGIAVLGLGLAGGAWISSRSLRPLKAISETASKIAEGDLSLRIPAAREGNELGELVGILNETFGRLQESFDRQARFTADASHELRTPLSVLLMQTQSALARERSPEEYCESLQACQRAAQRMRRLTDSLLTLARLDSGESTPAKEPVHLDRITAETVEQLQPFAGEHEVSLQLELVPAQCMGDVGQIGQVIANLVGNAIHYNRPGGTVRVTVSIEPHHALLCVQDTGIGISEEDLPRIFERFYRTDKSRTGATGGTGLGLAITNAIVQAHEGSIEVESTLGTGTIFLVRLPRPQKDAADSNSPET